MNVMRIDREKCTGCGTCLPECWPKALTVAEGLAQSDPARCIGCCHCLAVCPTEAITMEGRDPAEIKASDPAVYGIEPARLQSFIENRRSVRQYEQRDLEAADVAKLMEAARYMPTGSNMQNVRYILIKKETRDKIIPIAMEYLANLDPAELSREKHPGEHYLQPMGVEIWKRWKRVWEETGEDCMFRSAPNILAPVAANESDHNALIALCGIEFMAQAMGLGALFDAVGAPAVELVPQVRKMLGLQPGEHVPVLLGLGYRKVKFLRTVHRNPANLTQV